MHQVCGEGVEDSAGRPAVDIEMARAGRHGHVALEVGVVHEVRRNHESSEERADGAACTRDIGTGHAQIEAVAVPCAPARRVAERAGTEDAEPLHLVPVLERNRHQEGVVVAVLALHDVTRVEVTLHETVGRNPRRRGHPRVGCGRDRVCGRTGLGERSRAVGGDSVGDGVVPAGIAREGIARLTSRTRSGREIRCAPARASGRLRDTQTRATPCSRRTREWFEAPRSSAG